MPLTHPGFANPVNLPLPAGTGADKPIRIELLREEERGGYFKPAARLIVTRTLRTSGFLRDLPDAEARTLLLLMTYLRSDGHCEVSVVEAVTAFNVSSAKVRSRLDRLAGVSFRGEPIVHAMRRDSGLDSYVLLPPLVEVNQAPPQLERPEPESLPSHRDEIIAHSRAHYANPRAEVEQAIARQLDHAPQVPHIAVDPSTPEGAARQAMAEIGLRQEQIDLLVATYPIERIREQVAWLPHRHPKDASKLLIAAIQHNYEPPAFVRLQQAIDSAAGTAGTTDNGSQTNDRQPASATGDTEGAG